MYSVKGQLVLSKHKLKISLHICIMNKKKFYLWINIIDYYTINNGCTYFN